MYYVGFVSVDYQDYKKKYLVTGDWSQSRVNLPTYEPQSETVSFVSSNMCSQQKTKISMRMHAF